MTSRGRFSYDAVEVIRSIFFVRFTAYRLLNPYTWGVREWELQKWHGNISVS